MDKIDKSRVPAITKNKIKFGNNLRTKKGGEADREPVAYNCRRLSNANSPGQPLKTNMRAFADFNYVEGAQGWRCCTKIAHMDNDPNNYVTDFRTDCLHIASKLRAQWLDSIGELQKITREGKIEFHDD